MSLDIFGLDDEPVGPPRDQWKRPLLIPAGGTEREPYTRCSTFADYVSDKSAIAIWEKRALTKGMGDHEDLAALAAACAPIEGNKMDNSQMTKEQKKAHKENNAALDEIAERAMERSWRDYKADWGTAVHRFCDPAVDSGPVPSRMDADVASFCAKLEAEGAEILASELFVANDRLRVAGTFDMLVRHPGLGVCIWDIKTGQVSDKGLGFAIQLCGYAGGDLYEFPGDTRKPLESLTGGEEVNRDVGVICHVPLGAGRTDLYLVDLRIGRVGAELATRVRKARQVKDVMVPMASWPVEKAS